MCTHVIFVELFGLQFNSGEIQSTMLKEDTQELMRTSIAWLQNTTFVERKPQNSGTVHQESTARIKLRPLHFMTCLAASECFMLEATLFTIVLMLLVMSGIETNPGPTTPTSSACCNASQHFNRVKNTIAEAKNKFRSKVAQDTLTKKVLEVEETGNYHNTSIIHTQLLSLTKK